MRRGFIGLSGPLLYEGRPADGPGNALLDSPFGLMLLFDELVFLTRALCPRNLQSARFVRFLDEECAVQDLSDLTSEELNATRQRWGMSPFVGPPFQFDFIHEDAGVYWGASEFSDFGGNIECGGTTFGLHSTSAFNLIIDYTVLARIGDPTLELVTNWYVYGDLERRNRSATQPAFTEALIIPDISNYLTPDGPYHPAVDELRSEKQLEQFRRWVGNRQHLLTELRSEVDAVRATLRDAQEELFIAHFDQRSHYVSTAKILAGSAVDLLVPGAGALASLGGEFRNIQQRRKQQWQAFVVQAQRRLRGGASVADDR